mmetsp:Transcript_30383/g.61631  ORF Transcript_30383/g.61631 Transcript_30383/m.61631 type:complete len:337 (-) Transcript_30383:272-1282(-)
MVSSPAAPMPSEPPPSPPASSASPMGGEGAGVDAYGLPIGANPAGFSSPPPEGRKRSAKHQSNSSNSSNSNSNRNDKPEPKATSPFFKRCFGDESSVPSSSSYQKQDAYLASRQASTESYGATKAGPPPPEEDYGDSGASSSHDPVMNPNVQRVANSAEGAGTALPELILRMRVINLILCTLALGLEIPYWIGRAVRLNLSELVLGVCLCCFALLLCCWEMHVPVVADAIKEGLGLVYHPYGRAFFFVMMGGLSIGQGGLERILGYVILLNAIYTIYIPCRYPHYFKAFEDYGEEDVRELAARMAGRRSGKAWADPRIVEEEKRTLIAKYSTASGE